jgi:N-acyl-D-aspartate/D-glutamate deacylase
MVGSGAWTWSEAFRRCSWLPAQVLSFVAGAKGHLGPGADADIVVLDPATVSDRASYTNPIRPSAGVRHLLVHGTPVIGDGALDPDAMPGRPLRR